MKKANCPECNGSGQKAVNVNRDYGAPDYDPVYVFRNCLECMGKGKVPVGGKLLKYKPQVKVWLKKDT